MSLVFIPSEIRDALIWTEENCCELSENATEEQKVAFARYNENMKNAQNRMITYVPMSRRMAKKAVNAALEGLSHEECKAKLESFMDIDDPAIKEAVDKRYAEYK